MRPVRLLAAIALGTAALGAAPAGAVNIVTNGSFESGFAGWTLDAAPDFYDAVPIFYNSATSYPTGAFGEAVPPNNAPTNSPDPVGERAAYFVSDFADDETLSQAIFLTAGVYQIGFSAYLPANGFSNVGDASFVGSIAGVVLASFDVSTQIPTTWKTYAGSTTIATDGNYLIEFIFDTNLSPSKDVVIDQVYVIAGNPSIGVPEPASVSLLVAALLGAGLARRTRRRA
jgi:hypothetical protein